MFFFFFFLFAEEKCRNSFFFFSCVRDGHGKQQVQHEFVATVFNLLPTELWPPDSGKVHFSLHATYFTSSPPSFSNRSPPPPRSLSTVSRLFRPWMCLPGLTSLFVAAFDLVLHCFVLFFFPSLRLLYKSQLFFHLNLVCVARPMALWRSLLFAKIFLQTRGTAAEQLL